MNFEDFLPFVLPSVPGCPEPLALQHVVHAGREFCRKTRVWNYALPTIDSVSGTSTYTLAVNSGQKLAGVLGVELDGTGYTVQSGARGRAGVRAAYAGLCLFDPVSSQITLTPAPWGDDLPIVVDVYVQPDADQSGEWPDEHEDEVRYIAAGALASLCALPGVTWRDADTVAVQAAIFRERINVVKTRVTRSLKPSTVAAQAVWF